MNTTYSFATGRNGSLAALAPRVSLSARPLCVFQIRHNGIPVPDFDGRPVECASIDAAFTRIDQLADCYGTSVGCFRVERVWLA